VLARPLGVLDPVKLGAEEEKEILVLEHEVAEAAPRPFIVLAVAEVEEQLPWRMSANRASSSATQASVTSPGWAIFQPTAATVVAQPRAMCAFALPSVRC